MKIFTALASSLALAACSAHTPPPSPTPAPPDAYRALGTEPGWTVTIDEERIVYDGDYGATRFTVPRPEPRTTFNGHRYEARSAEHRLTVDITHVQCNDGMSDRLYADTVRLTADGRDLSGCGGEILPPANLADTSWSIVAINDLSIPAGDSHLLAFTGTRLSGKAGCNRLSASYSVLGTTLTAGPMAMTKMACAPELMEHERLAADILARPVQMQFRGGDTLILSSSGGRMTLKRAI